MAKLYVKWTSAVNEAEEQNGAKTPLKTRRGKKKDAGLTKVGARPCLTYFTLLPHSEENGIENPCLAT